MPRLDLYRDRHLEFQLELGDGPVRLGRAEGCDLKVNDPSVSREQAEIRPGPRGWILVNQSRFGTRVNAERVEGERPLAGGDRIYLGEHLAVRFEAETTLTDAQTLPPAFR